MVGRKARVPLVHEGVNPAIAAFIRGIGQETLQRIESLSDQEPEGIISVSDDLDDSRAEGTELDYYHGVVTRAAVPEDMDALTVPAGTWAVFENSGPFPQALQYLWRDVFTQWFPSNPVPEPAGPRDPAHPAVAGRDAGGRGAVDPRGADSGLTGARGGSGPPRAPARHRVGTPPPPSARISGWPRACASGTVGQWGGGGSARHSASRALGKALSVGVA